MNKVKRCNRLVNIILFVGLVTCSSLYYAIDLNKWIETIDSKYSPQNLKPNLKKDYKLLFVYSSSCSYCHRFAPVLQSFADSNDIEITSATADGGTIPGFEDSQYVPDIGQILNIKTFPTVLLMKNNSDEIYILSQGYVSQYQLSYNLKRLGFSASGGTT